MEEQQEQNQQVDELKKPEVVAPEMPEQKSCCQPCCKKIWIILVIILGVLLMIFLLRQILLFSYLQKGVEIKKRLQEQGGVVKNWPTSGLAVTPTAGEEKVSDSVDLGVIGQEIEKTTVGDFEGDIKELDLQAEGL